MKTVVPFIALLLISCRVLVPATPEPFTHGRLRVSDNNHFIVYEDGTPFYWFGDTAWELFERLDMEEAEIYFENRRQKGFTVIQAVVLAELEPPAKPGKSGFPSLHDNDPLRPNEDYFRWIDGIIDLAQTKSLYIGLLPTWGDKVDKQWGNGPEIFDPENAYLYGEWIGDRYRDRPNIIWIIGGDRSGGDGNFEVWDAMARGIKSSDPNHLMTFHPFGERSSSEWFHDCDWLDFNSFQSGHSRETYDIYRKLLQRDYNLLPVKPVLDSEPRYENHPKYFDAAKGRFNAHDIRMAMYQSLFSGSFGHTYGCHDIWQMYGEGYHPVTSADTQWRIAMDFEGAGQLIHARRLLEMFDYESRVPDQTILLDGNDDDNDMAVATRGDGYALVYLPRSTPVTVSLEKIPGAKRLLLQWYSPVDGSFHNIGEFEARGTFHAIPDPPGNRDIILIMKEKRLKYAKKWRRAL